MGRDMDSICFEPYPDEMFGPPTRAIHDAAFRLGSALESYVYVYGRLIGYGPREAFSLTRQAVYDAHEEADRLMGLGS
jgi:hypothetical protein